MSYLPILLKLRDRPCLVVGGGVVAARKVDTLLRTGARVTVISPRVTEGIERLAADCQLQLVRRPYGKGDLRGFYLAYAATGIAALDEQIAQDAESENVLVERGGPRLALQLSQSAVGPARRSHHNRFNQWQKPRLRPAYEEKARMHDRSRIWRSPGRGGGRTPRCSRRQARRSPRPDNAAESVASLLPDETAHNRLPKLHDGL